MQVRLSVTKMPALTFMIVSRINVTESVTHVITTPSCFFECVGYFEFKQAVKKTNTPIEIIFVMFSKMTINSLALLAVRVAHVVFRYVPFNFTRSLIVVRFNVDLLFFCPE